MIQDCPINKKKEEDCKRRKGGNTNGTRINSNMNTDITQAAIVAFHTSQTNDNSIPSRVQMARMGRKRGVNVFATNNYVSVTRSGSSNRFLSSIMTTTGFQVC